MTQNPSNASSPATGVPDSGAAGDVQDLAPMRITLVPDTDAMDAWFEMMEERIDRMEERFREATKPDPLDTQDVQQEQAEVGGFEDLLRDATEPRDPVQPASEEPQRGESDRAAFERGDESQAGTKTMIRLFEQLQASVEDIHERVTQISTTLQTNSVGSTSETT